MDVLITRATYKILVFLYTIQEAYGLIINHYKSETAVEGQNISLPCVVEELSGNIIILVEWIKQQKGTEQKIAVFHPNFPTKYYKNNSALETRHSADTGKLLGSVLNLFQVTVNDSGNYICEMTSFPYGSTRVTTKVKVTVYLVSLKSYPYGFVKEGDEVKIICSASPPARSYELRRSKDGLFLLESWNGEFVLPNVTRGSSDLYVCFPVWDSTAQRQQGFSATLDLTVNFLDSAECNTSSPLKVSAGEDVVISCRANSSQPLQYTWMKGNTTVSRSDTLSLSSVTSDHSQTYRLTAAFQNNQLQTHGWFSIHVLTGEDFTTSSPDRSFRTASPFHNQTTKHTRNFPSVDNRTWNTSVTMTTAESSHFPASTAQPNVAKTTVEPRNTSRGSRVNGSSSAPPGGDASTLHPCCVNPTHLSTRTKKVTFGTPVTTQRGSKNATYTVIPILLLVLVIAGLLYRRHVMQKRMEMPPPFKPPPPPVKYTSVRTHDVHMTDILV